MSVTCQVGIHSQSTSTGVRFRAFPLECQQTSPWRATYLEAEIDAVRMDGHACPVTRQGNHQRVIPWDRLVTKRAALYEPASALRYLPSRQ
jgi:hypothetical protein